MRKLDCFLHGLFLTLKHMRPISGHSYSLVYENDDIETIRCKYCGKDSVLYMNPDILEEFES